MKRKQLFFANMLSIFMFSAFAEASTVVSPKVFKRTRHSNRN